MKVEISQGQIWEVITENFLTSGENDKYNRPTKILKGEKIEIRYQYAWHFRTEDDVYFHADPQMILQNCKLIGVIWEKVKWMNVAKLDEILKLHLYDPYIYVIETKK